MCHTGKRENNKEGLEFGGWTWCRNVGVGGMDIVKNGWKCGDGLMRL